MNIEVTSNIDWDTAEEEHSEDSSATWWSETRVHAVIRESVRRHVDPRVIFSQRAKSSRSALKSDDDNCIEGIAH
jgi:hypothetical protein